MEKLVRDKIPETIGREGASVLLSPLSLDDFPHHLKLKLKEETEELLSALTPENFKEEMADILEVLNALAQSQGFEMKEVEQKRLEKQEERGGFTKGIFIEHIEVEASDSSHPVIQYCLANPKKYPEILTSRNS